jgi:hypothetical protein
MCARVHACFLICMHAWARFYLPEELIGDCERLGGWVRSRSGLVCGVWQYRWRKGEEMSRTRDVECERGGVFMGERKGVRGGEDEVVGGEGVFVL